MPKNRSPLTGTILNYLRRYVGEFGHGPTIREIQGACNISSTSVVEYHLIILEDKQLIERSRDENGRALARLLKVRS